MASEVADGPVRVLTCDSGSVEFNLAATRSVLDRAEVKNLPVVVLSVTGSARTGRSFLLNYLMRYLAALEKGTEDNWLRNETSPLEGVPWGEDEDSRTKGVLFWNRVFKIRRQPGTLANKEFPKYAKGCHRNWEKQIYYEVCVLVVDTQGLGDRTASIEDTNLLTTFTILLSSIQIYNAVRMVDEDKLKHLEMLIESASLVLQLNGATPDIGHKCPKLLFVVRDWTAKKGMRYGLRGGSNYLKQELQMTSHKIEQQQRVRDSIKTAYDDVMCCLLPVHQRESDDEESQEEEEIAFTGSVSELLGKFVRQLDQFCAALFTEVIHQSNSGRATTCYGLLRHITNIVGILQSGKIPSLSGTRETLVSRWNHQVVKEALDRLRATCEEEFSEDAPAVDSDHLMRRVKTMRQKAMLEFRTSGRGRPEETRPHQDLLNQRIDAIEEALIVNNKAKRMTTSQVEQEEFCRIISSMAANKYHEKMKENTMRGRRRKSNDDLRNLHQRAVQESIEYFETNAGALFSCDPQYCDNLRSKLDEEFSRYMEMNELNSPNRLDSFSGSVFTTPDPLVTSLMARCENILSVIIPKLRKTLTEPHSSP